MKSVVGFEINSIKKKKDILESLHKEVIRELNKVHKLSKVLEDPNSSMSDRNKSQSEIYKIKAKLLDISKEMDSLRTRIYGDWAPESEKGNEKIGD